MRQLRHADFDQELLRAAGNRLSQARQGRADRQVSALGRHLMDQIGRLIPVLPVPLVARVLLAAKDGALSEMEIKSQVGTQVEQLTGARRSRLRTAQRLGLCGRRRLAHADTSTSGQRIGRVVQREPELRPSC